MKWGDRRSPLHSRRGTGCRTLAFPTVLLSSTVRINASGRCVQAAGCVGSMLVYTPVLQLTQLRPTKTVWQGAKPLKNKPPGKMALALRALAVGWQLG